MKPYEEILCEDGSSISLTTAKLEGGRIAGSLLVEVRPAGGDVTWHPDSLAHHMCLCAFELRHELGRSGPVYEGYLKLREAWPPGETIAPPPDAMRKWLQAICDHKEELIAWGGWGSGLVEAAGNYEPGWLEELPHNLCPNVERHPNRKHGPAQLPHTCPFSEDVNGDYTTTCTCCTECEHECAMDI